MFTIETDYLSPEVGDKKHGQTRLDEGSFLVVRTRRDTPRAFCLKGVQGSPGVLSVQEEIFDFLCKKSWASNSGMNSSWPNPPFSSMRLRSLSETPDLWAESLKP